MKDMITILGPTASGKTSLAAALAADIGGEIISGDSRQVYRRMDIGTGKDLDDYVVDGRRIPYHLIDIAEPGTKYNLFRYQQDFARAYRGIRERGAVPILCGGTGLYIEAVLSGYRLAPVPENKELRQQLEGKPLAELTDILMELKRRNGTNMHNRSDVDTAQRAIRAIEIENEELRMKNEESSCGAGECSSGEYPGQEKEDSALKEKDSSFFILHSSLKERSSFIIGLSIDRDSRRRRITERLRQRLDNGMVDEIRGIIDSGVSSDDLIYYGLEYKYVTEYVTGRLTYDEMVRRLEIAIHQFAKRQMTWFRGMERRGFTIHWIDAMLPTEEKVRQIKELWQ